MSTTTVASADAPIVLYTDISSGPLTGGENNKGIYLSIFGKNFGTSTDMGTNTKVYLGEVEVDNYRFLGPSRVYTSLGIQQITVQVGSLNGTSTTGSPLPIKITVNGVVSNIDQTFTPNPGNIYFVSLSGNDTTGTGSFNAPYRTVQKGTHGSSFAIASASTNGAWGQVRAGDFIVMREGTYTDLDGSNYFFRANNKSGCAVGTNCANGGGTTSGPITIMGYPTEDIFVNNIYAGTTAFQTSCPGGVSDSTVTGAISAANSSQASSDFGQYINIVNLRVEGGNDDGVINVQSKGSYWRIVNNELTATTAADNMCARAGGIDGSGAGEFWVGNYVHDIYQGTTPVDDSVSRNNHGIYIGNDPASGPATAYEISYNIIKNIYGGNGFQLHGNGGGSGTINNVNFHHNIIHNVMKHGINIAEEAQDNIKIFNNLVYKTFLSGIRFGGTSLVNNLKLYNNTFYNTNTFGTVNNASILNEMNADTAQFDIRNNIFFPSAGTLYSRDYVSGALDILSSATITNNLWYGGSGLWNGSGSQVGLNPASSYSLYSITTNPDFLSIATGTEDFRLNTGSPAIDTGTSTVSSLVTNDLTIGTIRPQGAVFDIGAYEASSPFPYVISNQTISSSPSVGLQSTCSLGTYGNSPTSYTYQWQTNGTNVSGQTSSTYTPTASELGKTIGCTVTAINVSGSVSVTVTGGSILDVSSPSIPGSLTISSVTTTSETLSWASSTDDVAVTAYRVYRNDTFLATSTAITYNVTGLSPATSYSYNISAVDTSNNVSATSTSVASTTLADTSAPSVPASLVFSAVSPTTLTLSWASSTDDVAVTAYRVYRNDTFLATSTAITYNDTGLTPSTVYAYTVSAVDAVNNFSATSTTVSTTTLSADITAPSVPGSLIFSGVTSATLTLSWASSTDAVGVSAYRLYRGNTFLATTTSANYSDSGLTPSTSYSYNVSAVDAAANFSATSTTVSTTTRQSPVTLFITNTASTTFVAPANWPGIADSVEVIGGGASGANGSVSTYAGPGGGGGSYAKKLNVSFSNGASLQVGYGATTTKSSGTATWVVSTTTIYADYGRAPGNSSGGSGGLASNSVGDVKYSGGSGGSQSGGGALSAGAGGGGAAGPNGAGADGGSITTTSTGGGGGGGSGGGTSGANGAGSGGSGGNNSSGAGGGTGGTAANGTAGTNGGGGGGGGSWVSTAYNGGNGGDGIEWTATVGGTSGAGGGGGGSNQSNAGAPGNGGLYGAGGAGSGGNDAGLAGLGANGIIVIVYTPN